LATGAAEIEAMFYVHLIGRVAIFSRLDIQGAGPNTLGWVALCELAQSMMELLDVDELRIEGTARTSRAGPRRRPAPSFSGESVTLVLRLISPLDKPISVAKRLRTAGLTLRAAHAVINRLAETRLAICRIAEGANIPALAADLMTMNVHTYRRRRPDPGLIVEVRARHGLSQREFADVLGIDIDTLQNWEKGRNKPDAAVLNLVMAFDKAPELIEQTAFEPVA
jgi:DNA-binding transcriptional regulator YiaG